MRPHDVASASQRFNCHNRQSVVLRHAKQNAGLVDAAVHVTHLTGVVNVLGRTRFTAALPDDDKARVGQRARSFPNVRLSVEITQRLRKICEYGKFARKRRRHIARRSSGDLYVARVDSQRREFRNQMRSASPMHEVLQPERFEYLRHTRKFENVGSNPKKDGGASPGAANLMYERVRRPTNTDYRVCPNRVRDGTRYGDSIVCIINGVATGRMCAQQTRHVITLAGKAGNNDRTHPFHDNAAVFCDIESASLGSWIER